jgi:hypothetical protein
MARYFLNICAAALLIALSTNSLLAKENIGSSGKSNEFYKAAASSCPSATSRTTLEINNVRTILLNGGDMWWDLSDARFEVPKIDPPGSSPSIHSLFAGAVWLGGIDAGGNLKIAAQTYRQSGNDFWPGPLDASATINVQTCEDYDRHWVVFGEEIDAFRAEVFPCADCCDKYPSICDWPGKGNFNAKGKGEVSLTVLDELAPYSDVNGNGVYDPINGDYPVINATCGNNYADQMIFWVYNDKGNIHTETGGQAIGVQVGALAFAFKTSDEVNNMTFYRYDILNKGNVPIGDFYMGQWVDADLGCFNNDYVGCDTSLSLGFAYNGLSTDPDCASRGYGVSVPIIGVDYFEGPFSGRTVNGQPEQLGMSTFLYYSNDFTTTGNPQSAINYYNYMAGFWTDGSPFTSDRCNGYGGAVPTKFMFPGEPGGPAFPASWSECSCNNPAADRRWMQASGPFILQPGARNYITVGTVWVRQGSQSSCAADIDLLRTADIKAQALFNNCFKLVDGPDAPKLVIRELDKELIIMLDNTGTNNENDSYDEVDPLAFELSQTFPQITDITYTFQGYILYQLKNSQVTAEDFDDPTLARLVAQVDIEDDISKIVNKALNRAICGEVPSLMVEGANVGIRRSFRIREDLFATGNTELVNHKNYYYTAIAYAHNYYTNGRVNFEDTDCGQVPILEEQKLPYLQGRRGQAVYSAIPHKPQGADGGTILNSEYGDLLNITRIDGSGNGGFNLELTDESISAILASPNNVFDRVEYKGGNAPIQVQIVDPMLVRAQSFRLYFPDTVFYNDPTDSFSVAYALDPVYNRFTDPASRWVVVTSPDNRVYNSDRGLEQLNEQLIMDYGISISMRQVKNVGDRSQSSLGYITSSITYEDPVKPWLQFVVDEGSGPSLRNWIRSGQFKENDDAATYGHFFDDHYFRCNCCRSPQPNCEDEITYYDPQQEFGTVVGGAFAPYALAANKVNTALTDPDDPQWPTNFTYGPGFLVNFTWNTTGQVPVLVPNTKSLNMVQTSYNLDSLSSIDLVFTSDKSKWTRCVVVETGEDFATNEGGSFKGQIRSALSKDIAGFELLGDTGRSYFPGYAINVETGERLNIMFGENSFAVGENGRDMLWNPSKNELSPLRQILFGGGHYVYVMNSKYDEGEEMQRIMLNNIGIAGFTIPPTGGINRVVTSNLNDSIYRNIMYTAMPFVNPELNLLSIEQGVVPSTVTVKIRVRKPLGNFLATNENEGRPAYEFSTDGLAVETTQEDVAKNHLDQIRAVPNPYYAYSGYETSQLDNRIKITNLPGTCTVSIYSIDGVLIRQYKRDVGPNTHYGENTEKTNLDNSLDWDLKNTKNIPVSSGVYLIHVEAPGLGERTIKWFGVMRPFDLGTF